ncbi:MAG: CHAP domain-containing protein [Candidatus Saccharibacteria bacterium]
MKIAISKPNFHSVVTKTVLVVISLVIAISAPIQIMTKDASADTSVSQLQAQIDALEQDIANYHAQAAQLNNEAQTLQTALAKLASERAIIQAQIDINQANYDSLLVQIKDTEKKITDNQDALGSTIADMYVDGNVTPIEMLASSSSISDYMDKQEYQTSIRNQLTTTISTIKNLKKSLVDKKAEVVKVLEDQNSAKNALVAKESEQQSILDQTQNSEAAYQKLSADGESKKKDLVQQQQAIIIAAQNRGGTVTGIPDATKGNYPWGGGNCYVAYDGWGNLMSYNGINGDGSDGLGYACRQCTSYAAWRILEYTNRSYRYLGDAANWPNNFPDSMVHTTPRANSVGVISAGQYGHVVWVETDPDADGYIIISQYNDYSHNSGDNSGLGWGNYSKIRVHESTYNYYIYF